MGKWVRANNRTAVTVWWVQKMTHFTVMQHSQQGKDNIYHNIQCLRWHLVPYHDRILIYCPADFPWKMPIGSALFGVVWQGRLEIEKFVTCALMLRVWLVAGLSNISWPKLEPGVGWGFYFGQSIWFHMTENVAHFAENSYISCITIQPTNPEIWFVVHIWARPTRHHNLPGNCVWECLSLNTDQIDYERPLIRTLIKSCYLGQDMASHCLGSRQAI